MKENAATRILPVAVEPGDLVSVVAPASPPDPAMLEAGVESLRARGLKVRIGTHVLDAYGHLAGADRDRAADLMEAFLDPQVRAVFCARGGSGSARILPYLDLAAIAARPKVFVGYSDITLLHLAFARAGGWPTFYGPMVASDMGEGLGEVSFDLLWRLITVPEPAGVLPSGPDATSTRALLPGVVEGRLTGGTLCVIESSLGTPYATSVRGSLLALEDAYEEPWRADRMLTHLSHAGLLDEAAGFIIGALSPAVDSETLFEDLPIERSLLDHLEPLGKPVLYGFPFGHIRDPLTLPLGCRARLDAAARTLAILEPAVRSRET